MDHNIWFATSNDGVNWTQQRKIPGAATVGGPGLAWDGTLLWMVWRGVGADQGIYFANSNDFFGGSWSGVQKIFGTASSHGPRIAIVNGLPIAAWKGANDDHGIYWTPFSNGKWQRQNKVGGIGTQDAPAICADVDDTVRMLWRGIGIDQQLWTSSLTGLFWQPQEPLSWIISGNAAMGTVDVGTAGSAAGPALAFIGDRIIAAWRGAGTDQSVYFTQLTRDIISPVGGVGGQYVKEWSSQTNIPSAGSSDGPSLAKFNQRVHAVWKGVIADSGIYTAGLEQIPRGE